MLRAQPDGHLGLGSDAGFEVVHRLEATEFSGRHGDQVAPHGAPFA
jgi:hypothetical protein